MADAAPGTLDKVRTALRSPLGRRLLLLVLVGLVSLIAWRYFQGLPVDGTVEVRWTENPPDWIGISYLDDEGHTARWRREQIGPGADRFHDSYRLHSGVYWVRIEWSQAGRLHSIRKKVELPTAEPLVLMLEELAP